MVVLIIGILAAVALPQYTKAVEKSRMSEAVSMIGQLEKALEVYIMSGGDITPNKLLTDELDISISYLKSIGDRRCSNNFCYVVSCDNTSCWVSVERWQDGIYQSGPAQYYLHSTRRLADGNITRTYQSCAWNGGDIFASLRSMGYQESSC